jgi:GDPmannose 4,6-dehydratase
MSRGYSVVGTSRDSQMNTFSNLTRLGLRGNVETVSMAMNDFRSVLQVIAETRPQEVYNLAGQSSVALSFEQPVETLESISTGTLNLLEAIRFLNPKIRLYNASSSECFGDTGRQRASEKTPFRPASPYAVAKAAAHWQVASYREGYGLFACSGILFNHESPLRPARFVTQKVVSAACRISRGSNEILHLGRVDIERDWGWAPEYVEAMWRILQEDAPDDYVIATGRSYRLIDFVQAVFSALGLDWQRYVVVDSVISRPVDHLYSRADPTKAKEILGWEATKSMPAVAAELIDAYLSSEDR